MKTAAALFIAIIMSIAVNGQDVVVQNYSDTEVLFSISTHNIRCTIGSSRTISGLKYSEQPFVSEAKKKQTFYCRFEFKDANGDVITFHRFVQLGDVITITDETLVSYTGEVDPRVNGKRLPLLEPTMAKK